MSERLRVNEIFYSIQGESTWAGCPCVFARLTGCNLRCVWCDTEYAFHEGHHMSIDEIVERIRGFRCKLVEVGQVESRCCKKVCMRFSMRCSPKITLCWSRPRASVT